MNSAMIEAKAPADAIRRSFDLWSHVYGWLVAPLERKTRMAGLARLGVRPHDKVLEVAVGPGATLVEILKLVDSENVVSGVDLSRKMLDTALRRLRRAGFTNVELREADARRLPFPDESFDVLYNSYMLDLIPLGELPIVVGEFKRVLKPKGRIALVNMSKRSGEERTWYERVYSALPSRWVAYLFGGCRPVLVEQLVKQAGFVEVRREYVTAAFPGEVVIASKP